MRFEEFRYMRWAKAARAAYHIGASGVQPMTPEELGAPPEPPRLVTPALPDSPAALSEAIARRYGVRPENVFCASGTSGANFLAVGALVGPGDEVLVEEHTYEVLHKLPALFGARVLRVPRPRARDFDLDPDDVACRVTPRTRLLVVTDLHNPSGRGMPAGTRQALGALAERHGFHVLLDEVYLDALWERRPGSALDLSSRFVVTSSLTKVYGLPGLRAGWILAEPEVARRIALFNDYVQVAPVAPGVALAEWAFAHLPRLEARARALIDANAAAFDRWIADRRDVRPVPVAGGALRLFETPAVPDTLDFTRRLHETRDTIVVPGDFFDLPGWLRLGLGGDPTLFAEGLRRLGDALAE